MKKFLIIMLMIFNISLITSCSTYNSLVPNWMEIGSSDDVTETKDTNDDSDSGSSWWNPFSWF